MTSRLLALLPKFYLPILVVFCFLLSWQPLRAMDDFWAHAAIGRWMVQNGQIPHETLFLWGPGTPVPWIYHSWLSQLVFFKCMDGVDLQTGAARALILTCAIAFVILVWLWLFWVRRARVLVLTPFLFAITLWCISPRTHPRPELFSSLFLLMLMTFLTVWTERRDINENSSTGLPDRIWLRLTGLFVLFVVWANFHGGVATGLVFIALTIAGEGAQDLIEKRSLQPTILLCGVLLLCALAINFNPYGFHYWSSLRDVGSQKFTYINEWQNIFKDPPMSPEAIIITALIGFLSIVAWINSPRRRIAHLLWLIFAIVSYVMARRQIAQMAQICLLTMAVNAVALDSKRFWLLLRPPSKKISDANIEKFSEPPPRIRLLAHVTMILCLIGMISGSIDKRFFPLHSTDPLLPVAAAQFIQTKHPKTHLLVDYSTSSYANWHFGGKPPLYIDLINAYPDQLMTDYFDMAYAKPRGLKLLYDTKITHVMISEQVKEGKIAKFYEYLNKSPRWEAIYHGKDATIWKRRDIK